jgi:hypothetical protein
MNGPENTGGKQVGRFEKGTSDNPNGRPKGSLRHRALSAPYNSCKPLKSQRLHFAL